MASTVSGEAMQGTVRPTSRAEVALIGVYEISKLLASPSRLETRLAGVMSLLSSFLDMHHGLIALLRPDGAPEMVVGSGWTEALAKLYFEHLPERAIGQIVTTKMPLVVGNVARDPLFADWRMGEDLAVDACCAFIGVPIKERDRVVGTLTIDRVSDGRTQLRFDEDVRFLTMIANLVGQAVRLQEMLARDRDRLLAEQRRLEKALSATAAPGREMSASGIVGESSALRAVLDRIGIVARSRSAVLLRGETGTGKELFAKAIHDLSPRSRQPFVKLNCAALPESVLESELFGHEKGAFTGAVSQRKGRFELADGGTLFLDEIGEISASFQTKLLRVIQESEFERVGGTRTIKVNVRLVTATNRNLEEEVARGAFRSDLYYRISVVPVFLPPLRERPGDIPILAAEFLRRFNRENGTVLELDPTAVSILANCYFPGNVRELENCVRRAATFARGSRLLTEDFACYEEGCLSAMLWRGTVGVNTMPADFRLLPIIGTPASRPASVSAPSSTNGRGVRDCPAGTPCPAGAGEGCRDRDRLIEAMETAGWVQAKAARLLGLTPRQIGYALQKHKIEIKKL